jgi:threonine dehydratase
VQGKTVVAITSGANINFERLRLVSELADLGASTEVMMATSIPERPGAFREFVHTAAGDLGSDLNVTEFKYRCGCVLRATTVFGCCCGLGIGCVSS